MRFLALSIAVVASAASTVLAADGELKIEVTRAVECERKTQRGDSIDVHYRGSLQSDGSEFDASYNRGSPLSFTVGNGQVIKGCVITTFLWICHEFSMLTLYTAGMRDSSTCVLERRGPSLSLQILDMARGTWGQFLLAAH